MILVCIKEIGYGCFTIGNKYEVDINNQTFFFIKDDKGINWPFGPHIIKNKFFITIEEWREIKLGELGI